jgi:hypothetical protein
LVIKPTEVSTLGKRIEWSGFPVYLSPDANQRSPEASQQ